MQKRRIGKKILLRELRKLLALPDTKIIRRRLKDDHATVLWDTKEDSTGKLIPFNIRIRMDVRKDPQVSLVIHELLHVFMSFHLKIDGLLTDEVEESAILSWERLLYDYLRHPANDSLLESWTQAIERKTR